MGANAERVAVSSARADPAGFFDRWLELGERPFLFLERHSARVFPASLNPLGNTGALANAALTIATATGILLLFWYSPSVRAAWESVRGMDAAPYGAGLVRSLHRYSSDAAMLFALYHGARLFFARRFGGPRSFAWLTGLFSVATIWVVGWTGYWLVWDTRAQRVALTSAKWIDPLPIFAEPFSRSFLVDQTVSSLLFFVVFFVHLLVPLLAVVFLWLHVTRLARPRFLPSRALWAWLSAVLLLVSLAFPATAAGPARMLERPGAMTLDGWYLSPLYLTDHLGSGALWGLTSIAALALLGIPWALAKGRASPASVNPAACNGCTLCARDCPYEAIALVPRSDGRRFEVEARVDPARCTGCGICAGSCAPGGIALPQLPTIDQRKKLDEWISTALAEGEAPICTFACGSSALAELRVDPQTGRCAQLPGHRVFAVPCVGWVQPLLLERALKRGAAGVLVVACGPVEPTYREGALHARERLEGLREPALRAHRVEPSRIGFVEAGRGALAGVLARAAVPLRARTAAIGKVRRFVLASVAVSAAAAGLWALTMIPLELPRPGSDLVVSFRHPGDLSGDCRIPSPAELAALPVHMRQPEICDRTRAPVRLRVLVDGQRALERAYPPLGLSSDGASVVMERLPISTGEHQVRVEIGSSGDPGEWRISDERRLEWTQDQRRVALFDRSYGFRWFPEARRPAQAPPGASP